MLSDNLIVFSNKKFGDYVHESYSSQLTVEKANRSDDLANYQDLRFSIESNNQLYTKLYDKLDDSNFNIVNFLFLSNNVPFGAIFPWCLYMAADKICKVLITLQ